MQESAGLRVNPGKTPGTRRLRWRLVAPLLIVAGLLVVGRSTGLRAAGGPEPRLTWFGQSCFLLETEPGTRVVMDPVGKGIGYTPPEGLRADLVTVSHEHGDHNNVGLVTGAKILRGLTADKKGWMTLEEKVGDVKVRSIGTYHDEEEGRKRGLNTIFVFETGGLRIAHLGDLGHLLNDTQLSQLGSIDVVLVPVGGFYTIDAAQAARVVDQIRPRLVVIPMHYKTDVVSIKELATVENFLAGRSHVRRLQGNSIAVKQVKKRPGAEVVVLDYK